jgi:hypothetical protein
VEAREREVEGPETERREEIEADVLEREIGAVKEAKRRPSFEECRRGGPIGCCGGGDNGGDMGPRRSERRFSASKHSVHGML